jgi:hypothetical protein
MKARAIKTVVGLVLVVMAARVYQLEHRIRAPVVAEAQAGKPVWSDRLEEWVQDAQLETVAGPPTASGNAAEILWPAGLREPPLRCPNFSGLGPDNPAWTERPEEWRAAGNCQNIEAFIAAANRSDYDILAVGNGSDAADMSLGRPLHNGMRTGITALTAKARLHAEVGQLGAADTLLRAALRLSLLIVQHDGTLVGMEVGHRAMPIVLHHLESLSRLRGRDDEARELAMLRQNVPAFETCTGLLNAGLGRTGSFPEGLEFVDAVARDERLPLAMRVQAAFIVSEGYVGSPAGLLVGRTRGREVMLGALRELAPLHPWIVGFDSARPTLAERANRLWELMLTGPARL